MYCPYSLEEFDNLNCSFLLKRSVKFFLQKKVQGKCVSVIHRLAYFTLLIRFAGNLVNLNPLIIASFPKPNASRKQLTSKVSMGQGLAF